MVSFNYGKGDKRRVMQGIFYGIVYIGIIMLIGLIGLEIFAKPLIGLFDMSKETEALCAELVALLVAVYLLLRANKNIIIPMKRKYFI